MITYVDVNIASNNQKTALMLATMKGQMDVIEMLIPSVKDIDTGDRTQTTPLMIACNIHRADIARLLIQHGP